MALIVECCPQRVFPVDVSDVAVWKSGQRDSIVKGGRREGKYKVMCTWHCGLCVRAMVLRGWWGWRWDWGWRRRGGGPWGSKGGSWTSESVICMPFT